MLGTCKVPTTNVDGSFTCMSVTKRKHRKLFRIAFGGTFSCSADTGNFCIQVTPTTEMGWLVAWHSGIERWSFTGELSLSCALPADDG